VTGAEITELTTKLPIHIADGRTRDQRSEIIIGIQTEPMVSLTVGGCSGRWGHRIWRSLLHQLYQSHPTRILVSIVSLIGVAQAKVVLE
jgi:hypothetical protein